MIRDPGYYWVKRSPTVNWEIVEVHPADRYGQAVDSMGWDAGACLPDTTVWGPRISPPEPDIPSTECEVCGIPTKTQPCTECLK